MKTTMEEIVDSVLYEKKIKRNKKVIKETEINIKKILEADDVTDTGVVIPKETPEKAPITEPEKKDTDSIPDEKPADEDKSIRQAIQKARDSVREHQAKGELVLEIALALNNNNIGKLEIGTEEYATITNFNIIFNKFGINYKDLPDAINQFSITTEEKVSTSDMHSVSIVVEMIDEETYGIQVFIDEEGIRYDVLDAAIKEFDRQYGINIIDTINKKVRV